MSQQNFTPISGATHLTFRNIFNANANDAESRLGSIEPHFTQQSISSSAGVLTLDVTGGYSAATTLTEDITGLSITNSTSGILDWWLSNKTTLPLGLSHPAKLCWLAILLT